MNADEWLRTLSALLRAQAAYDEALRRMGRRLGQEVDASSFTPELATVVADKLGTARPGYDGIAALAREHGRPAEAARSGGAAGQASGRPSGWRDHWLNWIAASDGEGQRLTRLSIARSNTSTHPEVWTELVAIYRDLIERLRPDWLPFDPATRATARAPAVAVQRIPDVVPDPSGPSGAEAPTAAPEPPIRRSRADDVGMLGALDARAAKGDAIAASRAKALRARLFPVEATGSPTQDQAEAPA